MGSSFPLLRPLQLLTLHVLSHAQSYSWSVHGFGMLRLYIADVGRLHVWHSGLAYPGVSRIHTHSWDLTSTIVCGGIQNTRYIYAPEPPNGPPTYFARRPYWRQRFITGYQTASVSVPEPDIWLIQGEPEEYGPGRQYAQRADEIHHTLALDGTVTLMERKEDEDGQADIFWEKYQTFGNAKPRPALVEEIAFGVAAALEQLHFRIAQG